MTNIYSVQAPGSYQSDGDRVSTTCGFDYFWVSGRWMLLARSQVSLQDSSGFSWAPNIQTWSHSVDSIAKYPILTWSYRHPKDSAMVLKYIQMVMTNMDTVSSSDVFLHGKDSKTKDVALHPPWGHEPHHCLHHRVGGSIGGHLRHQISWQICPLRQRCCDHQGSFRCNQPPRHGHSHPPAQTGSQNVYGNLIETHREKPTWG